MVPRLPGSSCPHPGSTKPIKTEASRRIRFMIVPPGRLCLKKGTGPFPLCRNYEVFRQFKQVLSLCETESSRATSLVLAAKQARGKEKAGEVDPVEDAASGLARARRVGNAKPQAALLPWTGRGCFGISRSSWFKMRLLGM